MMATVPVSIPKGRIRAPFTGIPVPGERPVIVQTERLRLALAGVKVTDAAVIDTTRVKGDGYSILPVGLASGKPGEMVRALEITFTHGRHGRGRGRTVLYDLGYAKDGAVHKYRQAVIAQALREWAEGQRKNIAKKLTGSGTVRGQRIAQAIRKLEKEKSEIYGYKNPPLHPLLPSQSEYRRDEGSGYRDQEWRWHDERFHRKQLAALAGRRIRCLITSTTAYKLLRERRLASEDEGGASPKLKGGSLMTVHGR